MAAPLEHSRSGGYQASAEQMAIQQSAAAVANEAFSAEAIAAEAARREVALAEEAAVWRREGREQCVREGRPIEAQYLEPSEPLAGGVDGNGDAMVNEGGRLETYGDSTLTPDEWYAEQAASRPAPVPEPRSSRLAAALVEVLDEHVPEEEADEPEEVLPEVMGGAHLVRWILVPADGSDGWTLGISTESNTDEEPDAVYLEITQAMMRKWRNEPDAVQGLPRFAAGLMEKVADSLAEDLTDPLIDALERITRGELREKQHLSPVEPTRTAVGEDEPTTRTDASDLDAEPVYSFESLDDYVMARDAYAQIMSADEFSAFLDDNQDYEDEIERQA